MRFTIFCTLVALISIHCGRKTTANYCKLHSIQRLIILPCISLNVHHDGKYKLSRKPHLHRSLLRPTCLLRSLNMKEIGSSETSKTVYQSTQPNIPKDLNLSQHHCDNRSLADIYILLYPFLLSSCLYLVSYPPCSLVFYASYRMYYKYFCWYSFSVSKCKRLLLCFSYLFYFNITLVSKASSLITGFF
jgi:hypothetical protein